jgi:hypothetical protein
MTARYVHLVNADVDEAILAHHGITKKESIEKNLPRKCNICDMINSPESKLCSKCGKPLDLETAIEIEEKEKMEIEKRDNDIKSLKENETLTNDAIQNLSDQIITLTKKVEELQNKK